MAQQKRLRVFDNTKDSFPFDQLSVKKPTPVLGESNHFLIQALVEGNPIYIQTPPCQMKQGFTKIGKVRFCDFVFSNDVYSMMFMEWVERIEKYCHTTLFEHQSEWFDTKLSLDDIDNLFISPFKIVKTGNQFILRTTIPLGKMKIFNEDEQEITFDESFHSDLKTVVIIELTGIKCSPRHFQLEIETKQMLLIRPTPEPFSQWIGGKLNEIPQQPPQQHTPPVIAEGLIEQPVAAVAAVEQEEVLTEIMEENAEMENNNNAVLQMAAAAATAADDKQSAVTLENVAAATTTADDDDDLHLDIIDMDDADRIKEKYVSVIEKLNNMKDLGIHKYLEQKGITQKTGLSFLL